MEAIGKFSLVSDLIFSKSNFISEYRAADTFVRQPYYSALQLSRNFMELLDTSYQKILSDDHYDDGYLRIEYDNYFVLCGGHRISLPRAEFLLLSRLARNPNRVVSYEELWKSAWGVKKRASTESLKVYIYNLRRIFKPFGIKFESLANVGYRFVPQEND